MAKVKILTRYGRSWPEGWGLLEIELCAFRMGRTVEEGGLGKLQHFKNVVNAFWGPHNKSKKFVWHPWAERMAQAMCDNRYVGLAGCANSGKSDLAAVWAIVNFCCAPAWTMILVVSTSLKESRKRIWGSLEEYFLSVPGLPGKLVASTGMIRYQIQDNVKIASDKCGISLIAGEKKREKEAIGKLIGQKNKRVFLIADEMTELAESLLEGAKSNLETNPYFQFVGLGNPASHYDAFGILITPKNGWGSIHSEMDGWETELGVCVRMDGLRSPNILAGENLFPWLLTLEKLEEQKQRLGGVNSPAFWRMVRGMFCPAGSSETVFSEADLIKFGAHETVKWMGEPEILAGLDPSFTTSGDDTILYFAKWGLAVHPEKSEGHWTLQFTDYEMLSEDVTLTDEPRSFQIARQFKVRCIARGVEPTNAAFDATGAGNPFGDVVAREWSKQVLRVQFGGSPSDRPVSEFDKTKSSDLYGNKVSEIWLSGVQFLRNGQLKGVTPELAKELTERLLTTKKQGTLKLLVESKVDMKARMGHSPDRADAALLILDLVRERLRGSATKTGSVDKNLAWKKLCRKVDVSSWRSLRPA